MQVGDAYNPRRLFRGIFIPEAVARMPREKLSPGAKMAFGWLSWHTSDDHGDCAPSAPELAMELGVSIRQVGDYLAQLEREGLIRQYRRGPDSNEFEFVWHSVLESCVRKDRKKSSDQQKRSELNPEKIGTKVPDSSFIVLKNKELEITPIVPFENSFTEERLSPDVTGKSVDWTSSELKKFWSRYAGLPGAKRPNAQERERHKRWLLKRSPEDTLTALYGYRELGTRPYPIEVFKATYFDCFRSGSEPTDVDLPAITTRETAVVGPGAPNDQERVILTWNQMVPSNPIDPPWDWGRDRQVDLLKATQDQLFIEKLPEICSKAEALAKSGNKSRDFRWMIKSFGKKAVGNWWDFLNQKEAPKFKFQETDEEKRAKIVKHMGGN